MITTRDDYIELLYKIQDPNRQTTVIKLPKDEPICKIDLDTRSIQVPDAIKVVEFDHNSETLYFSVDRYYDNVDLSTLFAVVQYKNADPNNKKNGYIYAVPYFDISTLPSQGEEDKMLLQWAIEGPATAYSGKVTFSIKFYRISEVEDKDENGNPILVKVYDYILNTLTTQITILHGMDVFEETENYIYDAETVLDIYQRIEEVSRANDLCWIMLDQLYDETQPIITAGDYPDKTIDKSEQIYSNIT